MRLYFVRHAQSEANVTRRLLNRGEGAPLSDLGREQAAQLAQTLSSLTDEHFAEVITSSQVRAIETGSIIASALGVPTSTEPGLAEYDVGIYEGRADEGLWREYRRVIEEWMLHGNLDASLEGGETLNDIKRRFLPVIHAVQSKYAHTDSSIILVGHAGTYRIMLPLVLANIDNAFSIDRTIPNADYVLAEQQGDMLICLRWAGLDLAPVAAPIQ